MIKLLVYTDGRPAARRALEFGAVFARRLKAGLGVVTVRRGTGPAEDPLPLGTDFPISGRSRLSAGLNLLCTAALQLVDQGLLAPLDTIRIYDGPGGPYFRWPSPEGRTVLFTERFGHFIEALNGLVDEADYDLLVAAPPRRHGLHRLVLGETSRRLALDLHASLLLVRGGGPDSRFLLCADGSASSQRQISMLQALLPAVRKPVDLIWVRPAGMPPEALAPVRGRIHKVGQWLATCGSFGRIDEIEADSPLDPILEAAGTDAVIVMGASLRHDVYRRVHGSLPIQVMARTGASLLLVKLPPEAGGDDLDDPLHCAAGG